MANSDIANFPELRLNCQNWNIDSEELLLRKLKLFTDRYTQQFTDLSKNIQNFERNMNIVEIEQLKAINVLQKLSLSRFVEHMVGPEEPSTTPQSTEPTNESKSNLNIIENMKSVLDISLKNIQTDKENRQQQQSPDDDTISVVSESRVIEKGIKNIPLPFIIGTNGFKSNCTAGVAKMMNNMQYSLENGGRTTFRQSYIPTYITGIIPGVGKTMEDKEIPLNDKEGNVKVEENKGPNVPVPPPLINNQPKPPTQETSGNQTPKTEQTQSNAPVAVVCGSGPAVPPPPPLIIFETKPPEEKKEQVVQKKEPPVKKEPQLSMQEMLKLQFEKMKKKNDAQEEDKKEEKKETENMQKTPKQPVMIAQDEDPFLKFKRQTGKPVLPTGNIFKDEDEGDDTDVLEAIIQRVSLRGKKIAIQPEEERPSESKNKQTGKNVGIFNFDEENADIVCVRPDKNEELEAKGKKLDALFEKYGDDNENNFGKVSVKDRTETITKKINMFNKPENKPNQKPVKTLFKIEENTEESVATQRPKLGSIAERQQVIVLLY